MTHIRLSRCRAAIEQGFNPLAGDGVPAEHGTQKRATDGGVGVSVSAAHDGIHCIGPVHPRAVLQQILANFRRRRPLRRLRRFRLSAAGPCARNTLHFFVRIQTSSSDCNRHLFSGLSNNSDLTSSGFIIHPFRNMRREKSEIFPGLVN